MRNWILNYYLKFRYKKLGFKIQPDSVLRELKLSQYWERCQIEKDQLRKINDLVHESISNTEYYNKKLLNGSFPFKSIEKFEKAFPLLNKEDISMNYRGLTNDSVRNYRVHNTSGSTGKPTKVKVSSLAEVYRWANRMRFLSWWGLDIHDKNILIWKIPKRNRIFKIFKTLEYRLLGIKEIDIFNLNDQNIERVIDEINAYEPRYIRGIKSGLYELGKLMDKHKIHFINSKLKLVVSTAEVLLTEERFFMETVFKCKIANEYGAADAGQFAYECPEGSLHINEESIYIHTTNDSYAIITELFNYGMPLINFKNEDRLLISKNPCICGRSLRVIEEVKGRECDVINLPDGSKKLSIVIAYVLLDINKKYKDCIFQFRTLGFLDALKIQIIPGKKYTDEISKEVLAILNNTFANQIEIEIELVDIIERESNGKLRSFIRINKKKNEFSERLH